MQHFDWDSVRNLALESIGTLSDLQCWSRRSQEYDYGVDSATSHLTAIENTQAVFVARYRFCSKA